MPALQKNAGQVGETLDADQTLVFGWDFLAFERPRARVGYEDCPESRFERRVNVRFRAVADHPGALAQKTPFFGEPAVRGSVLLFDYFAMSEILAQSGAVNLGELLFRMSFGEEREFVNRAEARERLLHTRHQFHRRV